MEADVEEAEGVDVGHALEHLIDEAVDLLLVDRVHHDQFAQGPADLETLPSPQPGPCLIFGVSPG